MYRLFLILAALALPHLSYAQSDSNLDDLLELDFKNLSEVVTSVSKKPESSFQAAAAIQVITQEDIKFSGVRNLAEALRMVPGIQVSRSDSSNWAITSRGFNDGFGNKLLVLIDGRSIYTPLFSGVYWDMQDTLLQDIERIEVIRGPGATLWGANAVNGIINIITKKASDTQGTIISTGYGNEEKGFLEGRYGGNIDNKTFHRTYLKLFNKDETKTIAGNDGGNDWSGARGGFRIDHEQSKEHSFTFQGDVYDQDVNLNLNLPTNTSPFINPISDTVEQFGTNLLAKWNYKASDNINHTLQVYYDHAQYYYALLKHDISTFDIDFQSTWNLNKQNEIVWGTGYRYISDHLRGTDLISYVPEKRNVDLYSAFIQNKFTIIPETLSLTFGSKFEHNDFTGFEIQPSIRSTWTPSPNHTVWAAISRAVRTPNRSEDDVSVVVSNLNPGFIRWVGNRQFESEDVLAYEIGYRIKPKRNLLIDTTIFYNEYDDLRTNELDFSANIPADTALGLPFHNGAEGTTYGIEIASTWNVRDNWEIKAAYSYLNVDIQLKDFSTDSLALEDEGKAPKNQFNIRSNIYLPHNVELSNSLYYVDNLSSIGIPSFIQFDSRVSWEPVEGLELSLVGLNLFDDRHQEFTAPLHGEANEIDRSIYGQITWRY